MTTTESSAAPDEVLALSKIPVENIFYLLGYAYDQLPESDRIDFDPATCPDIANLLARILARSICHLAKRGLDREYLTEEEATPRLRGRIQLMESHRRMVKLQARMICRFDELQADFLPNQLLRTTCDRFLRTDLLDRPIRREIAEARKLLANITPIRPTLRDFSRVRYHRNNRRYHFPIEICRLVHLSLSPSENDGAHRFQNFLREKRTMATLFEKFVRNFARTHLVDARVSAMKISWEGKWEASVASLLPGMQTDVTVDHPEYKLILDCKYYPEALSKQHRGEGETFRSAHLYQLTSYLRNKASEPNWANVSGALLYPTVDRHLDERFELNGHRIHIATIDLATPWQKIESRLLRILGPTPI